MLFQDFAYRTIESILVLWLGLYLLILFIFTFSNKVENLLIDSWYLELKFK